MSSITEIRHRVKVVEETRKITKAMYLIASSKMRRAIDLHDKNLEYFKKVRSDIRFILDNAGNLKHPFFGRRPGMRTAYLVIAADKGMCGSYNQNVLNLAYRHMQDRDERYIFTVGQMTREFFEQRGMEPDVEFLHIIQNPRLNDARAITENLCELYEQDMLDEVFVVYTDMESSVKQTPRVLRLLPILREDFAEAEVMEPAALRLNYHPSRQAVLDALVPQYLIGQIYGSLVQAFASEQCIRMSAMDSSTRNADEMLGKLKVELNRARQAAITQELTEIISGSEFTAGQQAGIPPTRPTGGQRTAPDRKE